MRKFKMLIMAFAAIMTIGSLCSCGSDDKDNNDSKEPNAAGGNNNENTPTYVSANLYNFFLTSDHCFDAFNIMLSYKDINDKTIVFPFEKDESDLVNWEMGNSLGFSTWYKKMTDKGKKVYASVRRENITVPASVNFSYEHDFTFKADSAITHPGTLQQEIITLDYIYYSCLEITKSDGKTVIIPIYDGADGESWPLAPRRGEQIAGDFSKKYVFSVSLSAKDYSINQQYVR